MKDWQIACIVIPAGAVLYWVTSASERAPIVSQPAVANADDVLVSVGNIGMDSVEVFIKNVGPQRLASVSMHCTFRDKSNARIDSVPVYVTNLAPGDSQKEIARTPHDGIVWKADCLVESVRR